MRLPTLLAALLALGPISAFAQGTDFKGLDLTEDPKKEEEKKPAEDTPPPLPPPEPDRAKPAATAPAEQKLDEVQIANEDRVKSVQRKAFLKKYRFEISPIGGFVTLNDAFYPKGGYAGHVAFFFSDSLGLGVRFNQFNVIPNDNVRLAKRELQAKLPYVHPKWSVNADLMWSPVYGKVSMYNSINTFDIFLLGGAGVVWSQTSPGLPEGIGAGPHIAAHVGIGNRFHLSDWIAIEATLMDELYADQPGGQNKAILQNLVTLNLGLSIYLPLGFDYKEP